MIHNTANKDTFHSQLTTIATESQRKGPTEKILLQSFSLLFTSLSLA